MRLQLIYVVPYLLLLEAAQVQEDYYILFLVILMVFEWIGLKEEIGIVFVLFFLFFNCIVHRYLEVHFLCVGAG